MPDPKDLTVRDLTVIGTATLRGGLTTGGAPISTGDVDTNGGSVRAYLILIREPNTSDNVATIEVQEGRLKFTGQGPVLFDSGLDAGGYGITGLPTSDPGIAGALWNDNGTPVISTGEPAP